MSEGCNGGLSSSRRDVLKSVPAASSVVPLGGIASGSATTDGATTSLGDFTTGLDGWTTTGGNELTRVSESEMPAAVTVGDYALGVDVHGDRYPMIENRRRVREASFSDNPYLLAHVIGIADGTDSKMVFAFRLHHTASPDDHGQENRGNGGSQQNGPPVVESGEKTVPQLRSRHIRWDLSDLDDEVLETAKRLEITWYLEDHPPERGHRGRDQGEFEYEGFAAFDDIRLTDDVTAVDAVVSRDKMLDLHSEHGMLIERRMDERSADRERGVLVFGDGAEIPFTFEVVGDGQFRYTVDCDTFSFGGGSE